MRIAGYVADSLIDGPGVRLVVFFQGCYLKCPGCQNPETHDPDGGRTATLPDVFSRVTPITTGITVSGGEPTLQIEALEMLLTEARRHELNTMLYTGLNLSQLINRCQRILPLIDYLKCGPFEVKNRDLSLPYCGSSNQRVYRVSSKGTVFNRLF